MNKSERYTIYITMVESELTHLNQKWEEIMQKLKVNEYLRVMNKSERYTTMVEPELTHFEPEVGGNYAETQS